MSQICSQNIMWYKSYALKNLNYSINSTTQTSDFKFWNKVCLNISIINPLRLPLVAFLSFNRNLCKFFSFSPALILDKQGYSCQGCSTLSVSMRLAVISSGYHRRIASSLSCTVRFTFKNECITGRICVDALKNCKQTGKYGDDTICVVWGKCFK